MFNIVWIVLLVLVLLFCFGMVGIVLSLSWQALVGVPWERTPRKMTRTMFELAGLQEGEHIVDFGSGDGSMVIDAARDFGAFGTGIEGRRDLSWLARFRARRHGLQNQTAFLAGDMFTLEAPDADVICSYLFTDVNAKLEPILLDRYPSGTRVVARVFPFPTLPLEKTLEAHGNTFRLYRIP